MKKSTIIFYLIFLSIALFSQDTIKQSKHQFYFKAGGIYKSFIIDNKNELYFNNLIDNPKKINTGGFSIGVLYNNNKNRHCQFSTGLIYYLRNDNYKNPLTAKGGYILKYNYINNDIELPIMFQYKFWKVSLSAGFNITLLNYRIATYTYVNDYYPKITLKELEMPFTIYPTFYVSYDLKIKNISFKPFIGFDVYKISLKDMYYFHIWTRPISIEMQGVGIENSLFIHGGVIIPLKYK